MVSHSSSHSTDLVSGSAYYCTMKYRLMYLFFSARLTTTTIPILIWTAELIFTVVSNAWFGYSLKFNRSGSAGMLAYFLRVYALHFNPIFE